MAAATPSPTPVYRKLTRMHRGMGTMSQLWLGGDHLLEVMSTGYTESYRRCYLRDIQSMLIVHTGRRTYISLTLTVLMLIMASIISGTGRGGLVGYGVLAGVYFPIYLWNFLLGPGCRVVVTTAVQQERVPSLCRLPKTRRIIAELKPLIEAAQAELNFSKLEPAAPETPSPPLTNEPPHLPPPLPVP